MPWEVVTVDTLVDVKSDNRKTIGDLLALFDKILCIFNDMKGETIKLEQSLLGLKAIIETEDAVTDSSVSHYNTLISQYANVLKLLLAMKVSSDSGLGSHIIKPIVEDDPCVNSCHGKTHTYHLSFKLPEYNWLNCSNISIVDNMKVSCVNPCPCEPSALEIKIGCSCVSIDLAFSSCETPLCLGDFCRLVSVDTPDNLHKLIAQFNKNMTIINKAIEEVNHLVTVYELM